MTYSDQSGDIIEAVVKVLQEKMVALSRESNIVGDRNVVQFNELKNQIQETEHLIDLVRSIPDYIKVLEQMVDSCTCKEEIQEEKEEGETIQASNKATKGKKK